MIVTVMVAVMVGVQVRVGVTVSVGVGVQVKVGVTVSVSVGVQVWVGASVSVGVGVQVSLTVGVIASASVGVDVNVALSVGVNVNVAVGGLAVTFGVGGFGRLVLRGLIGSGAKVGLLRVGWLSDELPPLYPPPPADGGAVVGCEIVGVGSITVKRGVTLGGSVGKRFPPTVGDRVGTGKVGVQVGVDGSVCSIVAVAVAVDFSSADLPDFAPTNAQAHDPIMPSTIRIVNQLVPPCLR